jgi:hypothetical protein
VFPLSRIVYCAHCHKHADEKNDPSLRVYLIGYEGARVPRYRHAERRHECGARNHSVKAGIVERGFARLVATLCIRPEAAPGLAEMLAKANQQNLTADRKAEMLSEITRKLLSHVI